MGSKLLQVDCAIIRFWDFCNGLYCQALRYTEYTIDSVKRYIKKLVDAYQISLAVNTSSL